MLEPKSESTEDPHSWPQGASVRTVAGSGGCLGPTPGRDVGRRRRRDLMAWRVRGNAMRVRFSRIDSGTLAALLVQESPVSARGARLRQAPGSKVR